MRAGPRILASLLMLSPALLCHSAVAQVDLTGEWGQKFHEDGPERGPGPEIGDYTGIPITEAARVRADAWDAQRWEMVEHECEPHPADYAPRGPAALRMWSEVDSIQPAGCRLAHAVEVQAFHANDLHGRAASPLKVRSANLAGIFHR